MRRIVLATAFAALMGCAAPAFAQMDSRAVYDRMERLERDLQVLQQQVSRGGAAAAPRPGVSSPTVITSPAAGGAAYGGGEAIPSGMAVRLDDRLDQMEEQLRQLTGKVEEANHKAQQAARQLERLQADIDLRFKDLQQSAAQAQAPAQAPAQPAVAMPGPGAAPPANAPMPLAKNANVGGNSSDGAGPAPGPQVLGSMPKKDLDKALAQPQPQPAAVPAAPAKPADPKAMYDEAYAAATRGDYAAAEKGFQAFLDKNPKHDLAGNASFWLADIAYTQKDFKSSAALFADAYKKYPKHGKSPDMLFKLGASFGQLGMKKEACKALSLLFAEHPDMPDRVKRAATAERQKHACS